MSFAHKKLACYQESILFVAWVSNVLRPGLKKGNAPIGDQIGRASQSVPLNIAEGVGRWLPADKNRHYRIARASAAECDAAMDVIEASGLYNVDAIDWIAERSRIGKISFLLLKLIESVEKREK